MVEAHNSIIDMKIQDIPKAERPREKLVKNGEHTLTDSELLAILLRTGTEGENAIDLARRLLNKFKTFQNMSHTDIRDWKEFKGLGEAKIAQLKAALELARRFNHQSPHSERVYCRTTEDVIKLFLPRMRYLKNEIFKAVFCDSKNRIIDVVEIAQGTPTESYPVIRELISKALQNFAAGIICLHNHPFGDPAPSKDDEIFTKTTKEVAMIMGISFLDHIIFGEDSFYSSERKTIVKY